MQRRSFLRNAACLGTCASLLSPLAEAIVADPADAPIELRLECVDRTMVVSTQDGPLQVRAVPVAWAADLPSLRVRAWFASDAGPRAFDLASFGPGGSSQRLRFGVDPAHFIGFEAATGRGLDDCSTHSACTPDLAGLRPGRYRLWLSRAGRNVAAVDLQVDARTA